MKIKLFVLLLWFSASTCAFADEGRIAITGPVVITSPGSYVLVNDVVGTFEGIGIDSSDVKLDLNGFTVRQAAGAYAYGIAIRSGRKNIEVTNGAITGFAHHGIYVAGNSRAGRNLRFSRLRISDNGAYAISLEGNAGFVVEDCAISGNSIGIYSFAAGLILNNVIGSNSSRGLAAFSNQVGYRSNVFYANGTDVDGMGTNLGDNLCSGAQCP